MKISKKVTDKQWHDYNETVSFCVRPFPFSSMKNENAMETLKEQFLYCVVEWKGIDDDDKSTAKKKVAFKCNDENKLYLYDYSDSIRNFIFEKINELDSNIDIVVKN